MDLYALSDTAIEVELGRRLRALRLRKNITQDGLAQAAGLSRNAVRALEAGGGKLATLIPVLRELGALDQLDAFIPEPSISPMQLLERQGKPRERASGAASDAGDSEESEW